MLVRLLGVPIGTKAAGAGALTLLTLAGMFLTNKKQIFVPGRTSDGHHLIERACAECHSSFAGVKNESCETCHTAELQGDTHPVGLFDDPRWAETVAAFDVGRCSTCHAEHQVAPGGVAAPAGFCFSCHDDVRAKRKSHASLAPESCGSAGCHNYHDNARLTTAFLGSHVGEPDLLDAPAVLERVRPKAGTPPDVPVPVPGSAPTALIDAWRGSGHAATGVGCAKCHAGAGQAFVRTPPPSACATCHDYEHDSFLSGKHGMRLRAGLEPLTPGDARQPMRAAARDALSCSTCHDPHSLDTRAAATDACLGCHDDGHSRSFKDSRHHLASTAVAGGQPGAPGATEVTCATCHLPRMDVSGKVRVNHSNTFTLRPVDRMMKLVCMDCHGMPFALAGLLDRDLAGHNFQGRPARPAGSVALIEEWVSERQRRTQQRTRQ